MQKGLEQVLENMEHVLIVLMVLVILLRVKQRIAGANKDANHTRKVCL